MARWTVDNFFQGYFMRMDFEFRGEVRGRDGKRRLCTWFQVLRRVCSPLPFPWIEAVKKLKDSVRTKGWSNIFNVGGMGLVLFGHTLHFSRFSIKSVYVEKKGLAKTLVVFTFRKINFNIVHTSNVCSVLILIKNCVFLSLAKKEKYLIYIIRVWDISSVWNFPLKYIVHKHIWIIYFVQLRPKFINLYIYVYVCMYVGILMCVHSYILYYSVINICIYEFT